MKTHCSSCMLQSVSFLAVDHSGSYHYFNVICRKQGEQVSSLMFESANIYFCLVLFIYFSQQILIQNHSVAL